MKYFKIIVSFFILIIVFFSFTSYLHNIEKEKVIIKATKDVKQQYKISLDNTSKQSYSYFKTIIDKDRIKKLFALQEREILYYFLKDDYQILKDTGFQLVHFHLNENRSFLRMDQPENFGDDISFIRGSVVEVNKTKKPVQSLETGKDQNSPAYRFVYPLWYKNSYIGVVEISFLLEEFIKNINFTKNYYSYTVIDSLKISSLEVKENQYPLEALDKLSSNIIQSMNNKEIFSIELDPYHSHFDITNLFSMTNKKEHIHYIATYISMKNHEQQHIGYMVFYEKSDLLRDIEYKFFLYKIIGVVVLLAIFSFIYREMKYSKLLEIEVSKKTKELSLLNETLENKVQERTSELEESNNRLQVAAKASFDLLYEWDSRSDHLKWFGDIDSFLGFEKGEISSDLKAWLSLIHPEDVKVLSNAVEEHRNSTKAIFYEYRIRSKGGSYQYWRDKALPILDSHGKPQKWIGVCTDITEIKNSQEQLIQQSKLASMGEMIGNIAHQWRQPLSVISTAATGMQLLKKMNTLSDEKFIKHCETINDNAQYLSKTIDDFRNFIKGDREVVKFYLCDEIQSFLHLLEGTVKNNNIQIIQNLDDDIVINGYPNELIQCLINIFNNSQDVLKNHEGERYIFIETKLENDKVVIELKDNGGGIEQSILPHIFDPYFTTKHKSQGTGLGLSMTYNLIVEGMGGAIEAKNSTFEYGGSEYTGALFRITLLL